LDVTCGSPKKGLDNPGSRVVQYREYTQDGDTERVFCQIAKAPVVHFEQHDWSIPHKSRQQTQKGCLAR
jgi:hypothetical protein